MTSNNSFPPGWYPDPDNSLQQRYWDGIKWTSEIQTDPRGAEAWLSRSEVSNTDLSGYIRYVDKPTGPANGTSASTATKWLLGIVISLVIIFSLQSCGNRGWQMGVDGNGYKVTCRDGTISMSGGIQGACSQHGGVG